MARFVVFFVCYACLTATGAFGQSPNDVKLVQAKLSGYGTGKMDGLIGRRTRTAIRNYQRDWQIRETGEITSDLIARLKREHPKTKPQWYPVANMDCSAWNEMPQPREALTWTGGCVDGLISGAGQTIWKFLENGASQQVNFVGEYRKGKRHGHGAYTLANGDRFDGEWKYNKLDGRGHYMGANGDRYDGEWKGGELNGRGVYTAANGEHFEGEWKGGELHGRGVYIALSGERYEGDWKDGKPNGQGMFIRANGQREARLWRNGCSTLNGQELWINTTKKACGF